MIQVSLMGLRLAVGGVFLVLAYFDVPYYLRIPAVRLRYVRDRDLDEGRADALPPDQRNVRAPA